MHDMYSDEIMTTHRTAPKPNHVTTVPKLQRTTSDPRKTDSHPELRYSDKAIFVLFFPKFISLGNFIVHPLDNHRFTQSVFT